MKEDFSVSVIIPVWNREAFLGEAVECVLQQTLPALEIIIVDDGSTDGTAKVAQSFGGNVRYFYQENRGPSAARNRGLEMVQGNVVAFLDSDDLWPKNKLEVQVGCLAENPSLEIVLGQLQCMIIGGFEEGKPVFENYGKSFYCLHLVSAIFRKSVFEKVGLLDESLRYGEDTDWFMRAREKKVEMVFLPEVMMFYRRHEKSMTFNMSLKSNAKDLNVVKVLKKSLDRRREDAVSKANNLAKLSLQGFEDSKGSNS